MLVSAEQCIYPTRKLKAAILWGHRISQTSSSVEGGRERFGGRDGVLAPMDTSTALHWVGGTKKGGDQ